MQQLCSLHWKVWGHSPSGTSQQDCSYPSWAQEGGWGHLQCYLLLPCALLINTASCREGSGDPSVTTSGSTLEKWCQEGAFSCLLFSSLQTQDCWTTLCLMKAEETGWFFFFRFDLSSGCTWYKLFMTQRCDTCSWKVEQDCHLVSGKIWLSLPVITFSY